MARWNKKLVIYHKVRKNEKLCEIAKHYNVSIKQIAVLNNLTNVDFLYPRTAFANKIGGKNGKCYYIK